MLGLRGVRLGIVIPGLFAMQARAILEAAAPAHQGRRRPAAGDHDPAGRDRPGAGAGQGRHRARSPPRSRTTTGVRPALQGRHDDRAAAGGDGRRRDRRGRGVLLLRHQRPDPDDVGLLPRRRRGVVLLRPTSRRASSGSRRSSRSTPTASAGWSRHAVEQGRATRPDLHLGVCGEHGGDPDSIHFFDEVGLDYVSCSPFRVPVARLEAGRGHRRPELSATPPRTSAVRLRTPEVRSTGPRRPRPGARLHAPHAGDLEELQRVDPRSG